MDTKLYNFKTINYDNTKSFLANELKSNGIMEETVALICAYVIVKHNRTENSDISSFESFIETTCLDDDIKDSITLSLNGKWNVILNAKSECPIDQLMAMLLFDDSFYEISKIIGTTPECITELSSYLLKIKANERLADFGCGCGSFIVDELSIVPDTLFTGIEINQSLGCIAKMRADIISPDIKIELKDIMTYISEEKFDKVFSNPPLGIRNLSIDNALNKPLQFLYQKIGRLPKNISSDWLFATSIMNNLKSDGKAVIIMAPNATFGISSQIIRKFFVDNGWIENIISLPNNIFDFTAISVMMVVLSFDNENISFIDASKVFTAGRRKNTLSFGDINSIIESVNTDSKISKTLSNQMVAENNYELNPQKYVAETPVIKDGTAFADVIESITRGAQIKADELDKLVTFEETGFQYIMLNDIQDGIVEDNLPYINMIDPKYEKYCINDSAFVISKIGYVFKAAYIRTEPGKKILVNGNMYIIRLKTSIINPVFLKAFIESESGQNQLRSLCSGSALPTISPDSLKKMVIPLPDIKIQDEISDIYSEKLDEIKKLKKKLKTANEERLNVYKEYIGGSGCVN